MNSRRSLLEGRRIFQTFLIENNSSNLSNFSNRRFLNRLEPNKVTTPLLEYAELSINLPSKYGGLSINCRISWIYSLRVTYMDTFAVLWLNSCVKSVIFTEHWSGENISFRIAAYRYKNRSTELCSIRKFEKSSLFSTIHPWIHSDPLKKSINHYLFSIF